MIADFLITVTGALIFLALVRVFSAAWDALEDNWTDPPRYFRRVGNVRHGNGRTFTRMVDQNGDEISVEDEQ